MRHSAGTVTGRTQNESSRQKRQVNGRQWQQRQAERRQQETAGVRESRQAESEAAGKAQAGRQQTGRRQQLYMSEPRGYGKAEANERRQNGKSRTQQQGMRAIQGGSSSANRHPLVAVIQAGNGRQNQTAGVTIQTYETAVWQVNCVIYNPQNGRNQAGTFAKP